MEKKSINRKAIWITGLALAAIITTVALASQNKNPFGIPGQPLFRTLADNSQDTVPKKGKSKSKELSREDEFDSRNLDKAMEDVRNALQRLEKELKKVDSRVYEEYMDKFKNELEERFHHENWDIHDDEMNDAMRELELLKHKGELDQFYNQQDFFKKQDWEKMNEEMKDAMKELNNAHLFEEKDMLLHKLDMEKLNEQLEDSKWDLELNKEKMQLDFEHLGDELKKSQIELEHAHIELKNLKDLLRQFEKDGLIRKGKPYQIKIEKGNLYIDGKKQPDNITDKYRNDERFKKFFDTDNNFNMNSDGKEDKGDDEWL